MQVSIILPCFNEEASVEDTIQSMRSACAAAKWSTDSYELIVVNDGSLDGTAQTLKQIGENDPDLVIIAKEVNQGYGAALKTGIRAARSDLIATMDADSSYRSDQLIELIHACQTNDMVVGARVDSSMTDGKLRSLAKAILRSYVSWIVRRPIPDFNSGMRVFRKSIALSHFHLLPDGFSFTATMTIICHQNLLRVHYSPIEYLPRVGQSKINPIADTLRFFQLILRTAMYFAPLRVLAPIGVFLGLAGVMSFLHDAFLLQNLTDKTVLLFLFAMNVGTLGLIADMIMKRMSKE